MSIRPKDADALRRHGYMWEVGNEVSHGQRLVRIKLLSNDDVLVTPDVALKLGDAIRNAAVEAAVHEGSGKPQGERVSAADLQKYGVIR